MKKIISLMLLAMTIVALTANARAADFRYSSEQDGSVTVTHDDKVKDLHVASSTVDVTSDVSGDLVAIGRSLIITGNVENSSFLAGETINTSGNVGHHLRVAGSNVTISGIINGDLYAAGATITISKDTVINGSAYLAGDSITINGTVKGAISSRSATLVIDGTAGSVNAEAQSLSLQKNAVIVGDFVYKAPDVATINANATVSGKTAYTHLDQGSSESWAHRNLSVGMLLMLLGLILLLCVIGNFWPVTSNIVVDKLITQLARMFSIGLLTVVVGPILLFILLFTYVGIPSAVVLGLIWVLALMLGMVFGQLAVGSWVIAKLTKEERPIDWQAAVVGVLLYALIGFIPIVGGLFKFVITMAGFGAVATCLYKTERISKEG